MFLASACHETWSLQRILAVFRSTLSLDALRVRISIRSRMKTNAKVISLLGQSEFKGEKNDSEWTRGGENELRLGLSASGLHAIPDAYPTKRIRSPPNQGHLIID